MSADRFASLARTLPILEWVAAVSQEEGQCMLWMGSLSAGGSTPMMRQPAPLYGPQKEGRAARRTISVARIVWEEIHGRPARAGRIIYRTCGNPRCINPKHLREGTTADQKRVEVAIGRATPTVASLARMRIAAASKSKLSDADVAAIRSEFAELPEALPANQAWRTGAIRTRAVQALAARWGISPGHVYALARYRTRVDASASVNPWSQLLGMAA